MVRGTRWIVLGGSLVASLGIPAFAGDQDPVVAEGFRLRPVVEIDPEASKERALGGVAMTPQGAPIVYAEGIVRVIQDDSERILAVFDPPVFGDFLVTHPSGESVYFGESSNGEVIAIPLDGSAPRSVATVPGNFDLAFAPTSAPAAYAGRAFVSAFREDVNSIVVLDDSLDVGFTEAISFRIEHGFSGPLAFDDEGHLYYVPAIFDRAPPLVRFAADQIAEVTPGSALPFEAGEEVAPALPGAYNLRWLSGKLYLTNLGFGTGVGTIEVIDPADDFFIESWASFPRKGGLASPTFFAVRAGSEVFEPGAGPRGGSMVVAVGDFFSFSEVHRVEPELHFVRGEVNGDGEVDLSDAVAILGHLFLGEADPDPLEAADVNADQVLDITDPIFLLDFLFLGGAPIPAPFPGRGPDPND